MTIVENPNMYVVSAGEVLVPDTDHFPGWSLQTFTDRQNRFEAVVFRLDSLATTAVGLLTNKVHGRRIPTIRTVEYIAEGAGWLILKKPGQEAMRVWLDSNQPYEIRYPAGSYVMYIATSAGMSGCYLGSPIGIEEEMMQLDDPKVPDDFLELVRITPNIHFH